PSIPWIHPYRIGLLSITDFAPFDKLPIRSIHFTTSGKSRNSEYQYQPTHPYVLIFNHDFIFNFAVHAYICYCPHIATSVAQALFVAALRGDIKVDKILNLKYFTGSMPAGNSNSNPASANALSSGV